MFRLTSDPIVPTHRSDDQAGAFVTFKGRVRSRNGGRTVLRLEYEAYAQMALTEGNAMVGEAIERFGLVDAEIVHRIGLLEVGDTAVWVEVAAPHRREAFAAAEWLVDQLKWRVPIWKREIYAEGDSGWIGADAPPGGGKFEVEFGRRMTCLHEVGEAGARLLGEARVLIVGVGGLAVGALPALVGAGIGTIGLVDPDEVETSNLHRQTLFAAADVGRGKVERAAAFATRLRPGMRVETFPHALEATNADALIRAYDWIVDGTDSFAAKRLLNAVCRRHRKPLVTASVHRWEGQIMTVMPDGPCLACLFPQSPPEGCVGTCAEEGVYGGLVGLVGSLQATEVVKGILGMSILDREVLLVDLRTSDVTRLARTSRPDCEGCRGELPGSDDPLEVSRLEQAASRFGAYRVVDIREVGERPALAVPHLHIPMSRFDPPSGPMVLVCAHGVRSLVLAAELASLGIPAVSLRGGVSAHPELADAGPG